MRIPTLLSLAGLVLVGCGSDEQADPTPDAMEPVARATWYQDVGPMLSKHCMSCHPAASDPSS